MKTHFVSAAAAAVFSFSAAVAPAFAQDARTFDAWGHTYDLRSVEPATSPHDPVTTGAIGAVQDHRVAAAYRYSGPHAGGPADALIPVGSPQPVEHHATSPAYRYSGPHAGGPANALIPDGSPQPVEHHATSSAYRYSGPYAGGPANDRLRN